MAAGCRMPSTGIAERLFVALLSAEYRPLRHSIPRSRPSDPESSTRSSSLASLETQTARRLVRRQLRADQRDSPSRRGWPIGHRWGHGALRLGKWERRRSTAVLRACIPPPPTARWAAGHRYRERLSLEIDTATKLRIATSRRTAARSASCSAAASKTNSSLDARAKA